MIFLSKSGPFNQRVLSQANVRPIKAGVSVEQRTDDIARRGLLQGLSVRAVVDQAGVETGLYEVPAGGRRFRALELLARAEAPGQDRARALRPCAPAGSPRRIRHGRECPARPFASA